MRAEELAVDRAVARAFSILEQLALAKGPMRLSAVAENVALQKSTVHRILGTLVELGYAQREHGSGRYAATLRAWELGSGIIGELPIKRAASAFMADLHRKTGETVSLTVRAGDDVLYLDKIISPRPIRFTTRVGSRVPAPLAAGGKAMLAFARDARDVGARLATVRDDFDVERFMRDIKRTQLRGYAQSSGSPGNVSFAVAVGEGREAAISVSAPKERVSPEKQALIIEAVLSAGAQMAEQVGAR
jgi:DNA-binding IclR family transcriptional regulator